MSPNNAILDRLKEELGLSTDTQLSAFLGKSSNSVANWRARSTRLPVIDILTVCEENLRSIDWNYVLEGVWRNHGEQRFPISGESGMRPFTSDMLEDNRRVPLFLVPAPAGSATPGDDHVEQMIDSAELCVPTGREVFACRIVGDSMVGAGILDKDVVVVERIENAESSQIVVCTIDAELTIKRLEKVGERTYLYPANERYRPLEIVDGMSVVVWGVVRRVIHTFE